MTEVIAATVNAVALSAVFVMAGEGKLVCDLSLPDETVTLFEEMPEGGYRAVVNAKGVGVVLTYQQPSVIFTGYGNYKASKTATASAVGVGLES